MTSTTGKRRRHKGLIAKLGGLLCLAGLVSGVLFFVLTIGGGLLLERHLEQEEEQQRYVEEQIASFQDYLLMWTRRGMR